MRKYQPAQVDWPEIQQRIQAGESFNAVSKDYEVSRQAIQKRCQREGWISDKPLTVAIKRQQRELQVATMQSASRVGPAKAGIPKQGPPNRDPQTGTPKQVVALGHEA